MKSILLIGLGRFGKHVAMHLHNLGHQVMAVDSTEERVNAAPTAMEGIRYGRKATPFT